MTPATPDQQPRNGARPAGPVAYALTGWPVLAVLLVVAGLGWYYLARSGDWRGWVYAGLGTAAAFGVIAVRLMTARPRR